MRFGLSRLPLLSVLLVALQAAACSSDGGGGPTTGEVVLIGDSMLAWNRGEGGAIGHVIAAETGLNVADRSISGTRMLDGDDAIPGQLVANSSGKWRWLVMDGGGNDVNDTCACGDCGAVMDQLLSADGSKGAFVDLLDGKATLFDKAIVVGYPTPAANAQHGFDRCHEELKVLRQRWVKLASLRANVWFVNGADAFGPSQTSMYDPDGVHPSIAGSEALGKLVSGTISANP